MINIKILKFLSGLKKLGLKNLYKIVVSTNGERNPKVIWKTSEWGSFCGLANDHLYQKAISHGTNEPHFQQIMPLLMNESDVALDIGSNMGTHVISMSKFLKKGRVYAFEPQGLIFSILQENILLNKCCNVVSYNYALTSENNKIVSMEPFCFDGEKINNGSRKLSVKNVFGDFVLTRTLDSFDINDVRFIKLDVQGSEVSVLCGAARTINNYRPYMFVEIEEQHLKALNTNSKELIEKILSFKYTLYRINTDYPCDHICIPNEKNDYFEKNIKTKIKFEISNKICGQEVELTFDDINSQNYKSVKIVR